MPKKIIIVRHGETDYNVARRLQGWINEPLNSAGLKQAERVALRLGAHKPGAIYSSDQKRAFMTATSIGKVIGIDPIPTPALREDHLGIFQDWQWEAERDDYKEKAWAERYQARATSDLFYHANGTESLHHHISRVKNFFYDLESTHPDGEVIIVSHGGTINRIMEMFEFIDPSMGYVGYKNTAVSIMEKVNGTYQLTLDNDVSHL